VEDVLQYEGKRVVVTGCASGMGASTARILTELGAEVTGLDIRNGGNVSSFIEVDLRSKGSIDDAVAGIGAPVDSVFSVAGLPGQPFSDLDTVLVNFVGARHLIESLVPVMPEGSAIACVASNAGLGWQERVKDWLPLTSTPDFDSARAWCEANPGQILGGYGPSKQITNVWVASRAVDLIKSGVRLNCTNPGPTNTAMMGDFENQVGKEMIDAFIGPSGRRSTPDEQAWPLVFLNSPRSSYVTGEGFHTDAGFIGALLTGRL
jgi:NAD(P)-dependent dehydrogenase (short-subunit alcohol dehydrogenase family)